MRAPLWTPAGLIIAAACGISGPSFNANTGEWTVDLGNGMQQVVAISVSRPLSGDTVVVTSRVVKQSGDSIRVTHRICGLTLTGTLATAPVGGGCLGYSGTRWIRRGDTLSEAERVMVESPAGTYTLGVQLLLDPEHIVEVPVTVGPR